VALVEVDHEARQVVSHARVLDIALGAAQLRVGAGGNHHALVGVVQERQVRRQVEPSAHHHRERVRHEPLVDALLAQLVVLRYAPIALLAYRPGADHHCVRLGAEVVEEPAVDLCREALRAPVERRLAVEARDHVEAEVRAPGRRELAQPHAGRELLGRCRPQLRVDQLHAGERMRDRCGAFAPTA
jgi:hypothetical protein